jgi:hypothetical protein
LYEIFAVMHLREFHAEPYHLSHARCVTARLRQRYVFVTATSREVDDRGFSPAPIPPKRNISDVSNVNGSAKAVETENNSAYFIKRVRD